MKIGQEHFDRWLKLFDETIDRHFEGYMTADAKKRAELMAGMFFGKLQRMANGADKIIVSYEE